MAKETSVPSKVSTPTRSRIPYQLITIFSALTACIIIFGIFHFIHEEKLLITENQNELSSINDLKAMQIVNWRLERMSNAKAIFNIPLFSKYINGCAQNPGDTKQLKEFLLTLETIKNVYRLESITAMDTRQNVICSAGKYAGAIDPNEIKPIEESLKENKIIFSDMHRHDVLPDVHIDMFIPISLRAPGKETRVGLIMLHIDPSEFLFPLIENWPLSSKTGETLLVTRQGDNVVYLTELRYKKNTALNLKFPINTPDLPAALAVQGIEKPVFGKDYRGENVLAALKKIPDSPWFLISKIDLKEIRAPIVFTEWLAAAAVIIFILFAGALTAFYWYKRDADYYRIQYALESEKKALEKHYSYLTKYANDIILLLDEETNFIEANEKACAVYGYTREELLKMKAEDVRADRYKSAVRNDIQKAIDANGVIYETMHVRKDGAEFPVEVSLKLIGVEGVKYFQAIIRDITEKRKAEEKILKINEELESRVKERTAQLEEANKYLESFSYSVSHDLRAPLRAIDGFSRILLEDHSNSLDSEAFRILNVVRKNTQDMGKLIDDLLRFSQVSRHELSITEINMGEMVKSVIGEIEAANFGRKLNFIVHDLKGARGDASVIKQALLNLLSNAVKFTGGKEAAVIEIGCKTEEKENTYYVKDNGVGFDMQYKDKLFGVFQRLHSEKEFGGTGIGLALVERIISRHGGKVRAEGKTGEGATFYFTLPA